MAKVLQLTCGLGLGAGVALYLGATWVHPRIWLMLTFMSVLSLTVHRAVEWVTRRHPQNWVGYYLGVVVLRLLACVVLLAYVILTNVPNLYQFLTNFFVVYLCFNGFEIYWLLGNLRRNSIS